MIEKRRATVSALALLLVLAADRLTKAWAAGILRENGPVTWLQGVLGWRYCENKGAAFSAFSGAGVLLCLVTVAIIAYAIQWYVRHGGCNRWIAFGLTLLIAGGLGNLYDRIVWGYVVDFIEVLFVRFAVFNVADIAVVCGTACLMIGLMKTEVKKT